MRNVIKIANRVVRAMLREDIKNYNEALSTLVAGIGYLMKEIEKDDYRAMDDVARLSRFLREEIRYLDDKEQERHIDDMLMSISRILNEMETDRRAWEDQGRKHMENRIEFQKELKFYKDKLGTEFINGR